MAGIVGEPPVEQLQRLFAQGVDYPLVFRELIQNADDCKASWLAIGFSEGIPQANHSFLRGPALFAVNDGPLRPGDIEAICKLGEGTKVGDAGSVGKFGLGLKSVFNFAELLFFADFRLDPQSPHDFGEYGRGESAHFDVLSPWLTGPGRKAREHWEPFVVADRHRLGETLQALGVAQGFAVWVPLRHRADDALGVVRAVYDEDIDVSEKRLKDELLRTFPLLQHLRRIEFKEVGAMLSTLTREGHTRRPLRNDSDAFEGQGGGVLKLGSETGTYHLHERLSDDPEFVRLHKHESWPTFTRYNHNGAEKIKDPALPHGGAVWQRLPAEEGAALEVRWTVFLPLASGVQQPLPMGASAYRLLLHGYFFPTDDRQAVFEATGRVVSEDNRIKSDWNRALRERITVPLILSGLPEVTRDVPQDEIRELTQALRASLKALHVNQVALTSRWQWARMWEEEGAMWRRLDTAQGLLPLESGFWTDAESAARAAAGDCLLHDPEAPHFVVRKGHWNPQQSERFLDGLDWKALLETPDHCRWLLGMLEHLSFKGQDCQTMLMKRCRAALHAVRKLDDNAVELLRELLPKRTAHLPKLPAAELPVLMAAPLSVLLLPYRQDNESPSDQQDGNRPLNDQDCETLLRLGDGLGILRTVVALGPANFLDKKAVVPVGEERFAPVAVRALVREKKLFLHKGGEAGLLAAVNQVLPQPLRFVGKVHNDLFQLGAQELKPDTALEAVGAAESLGALEFRVALVQMLLGQLKSAPRHRAPLRALLHGQPRGGPEGPLLHDDGGVWGKAARLAARAAAGNNAHPFVDHRLTFLSEEHRQTLGVSPADARNLSGLLRTAGTSFPTEELSEAERGQVRAEVDPGLLRDVPLLKTQNGRFVCVSDRTFLAGGLEPVGWLAGQVHVLEPLSDTLTECLKRRLSLTRLRPSDVWSRLGKHPQPWREWQMLLAAVPENLPSDARELSWLPLPNDQGLPLSRLLWWMQEDKPVGQDLLGHLAQGSECRTLEALLPECREALLAEDSQRLQRLFKPERQLDVMCERLQKHGDFGSGWTTPPEGARALYLDAFSGADTGVSPLRELLGLMPDEAAQDRLLKAAITGPSGKALEAQLLFLSRRLKDEPGQRAVRAVYLRLLRQLHGELREQLLPQLCLPSASGAVRLAEDLAPYDSELEPDRVLAQEFSNVLCGDRGARHSEGANEEVHEWTRHGYHELAQYLQRWEGQVEHGLLGFFLVMLDDSEEMRAAARGYFSGQDPQQERERVLRAFAEETYEPFNKLRARIELIRGGPKATRNLLGEPLRVPFHTRKPVESLFSRPERPEVHKLHYPVPLRAIDPATWQGEGGLSALLRRTLGDLYRYYLGTPNGALPIKVEEALNQAFENSRRSEETALRVTQRRLLKAAPQVWGRQLGLLRAGAGELGEHLRAMEWADRRLEQARAGSDTVAMTTAQQDFEAAQAQAQGALRTSPQAQSVLLEGVRERIEQSQYQPDSVPFELLQNADDALLEWEALGGELEGRTVCEVDLQGPVFTFRHRGRPINRDTLQGQDSAGSGYDGDLEKMLTLMASDKGAGVTGKFGLGFKSVYLLGDRPTVVSDRVAFTVVGGVYPEQPDGFEVSQLREQHGLTPSDTLIHLPVNDGRQAQAVLARFEHLAPLTLAFAQRVDELRVQGRTYRRHVQELTEGIEHLKVTRPHGEPLRFVCLRAGTLTLVLPLNRIFAPLEKNFPRLWCLAPVREPSLFAVAVNADFMLDPGRARVASDRIGPQMAEWSRSLHDRLKELMALLPALAQEEGVDAHALHASLWPLLATEHASGDLIGRLLWGEGGAARCWVEDGSVVPSGLPAAYDQCVRLQGVKALPEGMTGMLGFAPFAKAHPPGTLISAAQAERLRALGLSQVPLLTPSEVLKRLMSENKVTSELAGMLGHELLGPETWWDTALFESAAKEWRPARALATTEHPLYGVLPATQRLASGYSESTAKALHKRWPVEISATKVAELLVRAAADQHGAALEYILKRLSLEDAVTLELRRQVRQAAESWLQAKHLENNTAFQTLESTKRNGVLNLLNPAPPAARPPQARPTPPRRGDLERIAAWWDEKGVRRLPAYERELYGPAVPNLRDYDQECPRSRADWFTLLMLGSFQRMGRQTADQHGKFLTLCRDQGWLRIFSSSQSSPKDWKGTLNSFLERHPERLEYYHWMDGYVSYYQFGRWLDEYAELLLDLPRTPESDLRLNIETLLASKVRGSYSGGISAPPLYQALGKVGRHLVVREVLRQQPDPLANQALHRHAYAPSERVRTLLSKLSGNEFAQEDGSQKIHAWLSKELGAQRATFGGAFDIPLDLLARNEKFQREALGRVL